MHICRDPLVYACMHTHACTKIYICMYTCMHVPAMFMHACTEIHANTCACTHTEIQTCAHMHMCTIVNLQLADTHTHTCTHTE